MACPNRPQALKVLTGQLSPEKSNRMLEHCRRCGECREAFDFAAKTMTKTAGAGVASSNIDPDFAEPADTPRFGRSWSPARRNRRTMIVLGVAVLAMMLSGIGGGRKEPPAEVAAEAHWKRSLADGTPVVLSPSGAFDARPRVVTVLVPPGSGSVRMAILDDTGRPVHHQDVKPGVAGCFVEESSFDAPGGAFKAARLVIPFPESASLALDPGRSYGVVITISGAHASSSSVFQAGQTPAGLQLPPGEER
jgi:hypothetical protein